MKIVISFIFLAPLFLFSQKYNIHSILITKSNDTLHVFTADRQSLGPSSVKVLDSASGQFHTYGASDISELILGNDDYYKSAIVKIDRTPYNEEISAARFQAKETTDTVFLKIEYATHNIKLYSLSDAKRMHFFAQKEGGPIEELIYRKLLLNRGGTVYESEDKKFILQLNDLLADCPESVSGIDYIAYTSQAIEKVFDNYNRLCHKENVSQYRKKYKAKFEISALAGISLVRFTYKYAEFGGVNGSTKFSSGVSPIFGLRFNYVPAILHSQLSLTGDLYYNIRSASFSNYTNHFNDTTYTKNTTSLKDQYLNFCIVARYYFVDDSKALRPFVDLGYLAGFAVSANNKVISDDFANGNHNITENEAYPNDGFNSYQFAYIAGIGLVYKKLSIEYRYSGYTNYLGYIARSLTAISSNIAVTYRLTK